jgi:FkbM family methyltransferase
MATAKKIFDTLKFKLRLLKFLLLNKKQYRVNHVLIFREVFSLPYAFRVKKYLKKEALEGDYTVISVKDLKYPLYWPKELAINDLYMVIVEMFDRLNGHYYGIPETSLERGDVVLDCGAAEGLFSLMALDKAEKIYLAEPSPIFLGALGKTFNGSKKIEISPFALGSENKEIYFSDNSLSSSTSNIASGLKVFMQKVDDIFYKKGIKIDYLKADIEGDELDMLQGAAKTIVSSKPKIALTTYHPRNDFEEIKRFILSLVPEYDFKIKGIYGEENKPAMIHFWINKNTKKY